LARPGLGEAGPKPASAIRLSAAPYDRCFSYPKPGTEFRVRVLVLVAALAPAACTFDDGHPPVARVDAAPRAIPENDGFQTAVTLDGTASADPVDDPNGAMPLSYTWSIQGDEFRFDSGDEHAANPVVRFLGDRPATIELTVTDTDGLHGTAELHMQLSVR